MFDGAEPLHPEPRPMPPPDSGLYGVWRHEVGGPEEPQEGPQGDRNPYAAEERAFGESGGEGGGGYGPALMLPPAGGLTWGTPNGAADLTPVPVQALRPVTVVESAAPQGLVAVQQVQAVSAGSATGIPLAGFQQPDEQPVRGAATLPTSLHTAVPMALTPRQPAAPERPERMYADPVLVRTLRERAAERLHEADKRAPDVSDPDREQRGRAIVAQVVAEWADVAARERGVSTSPAEDRALAQAVFDWLFRAGPLEQYLTDPAVENILVNGYDTVWVDYSDRPRARVPALTVSDEELRELLRDLARRHGSGERTLSTSSPTLALRLPDGSRLQAITEVTPHTYVTVRRHRVRDVTLDDLVDLNTLDPSIADFLGALVRARKNVIVCGTQGVGKTSLLRALSHEIQADERVGTFETELELFLHELGHLRQVVPIEAREGNGERSHDGRSAGELTIGELIPSALRMSLSRMIVGEVRSSEIVPMLRVMTNSEGGSMCTLHVREPDMIFDRIAELCLEYGRHMTTELAYRLASNAVDYVVFLRMVDETAIGGTRHRFVSHVLEVTGMGEHGRPAVNTVFAPVGDDPRGVSRTRPSDIADLIRVGLPPGTLEKPPGWGPLGLKLRQAG